MSASEVEVQARALGWRPKEDFRGKPEDFVEADVFVTRGKEIMPILRKNNERLEKELAETRGQLTSLQQTVKDAQTAVTELKKFNTEMTRQAAEQARTELMDRLKQAKKDGDTDAEVELTAELGEAAAAIREAKRAPKEETVESDRKPNGGPDNTEVKQEFEQWKADGHEWYGTDEIKTSVALGIANKLRREGNTLQGTAFYDEVAKQTEKYLDRKPPATDKVEGGGRSTGGGSGSNGKGTSYQDMPEKAREACEQFLRRDITVGKGKTFESPEAFRKYYAETYFARSE